MKTFAEFGIELPSGRSGEVRAVCPRCSPSRKRMHQRERDLAVNTDDGIWTCHHCGWSGSLADTEEVWRNRAPIKPVYMKPVQPTEEGILPEAVARWFAERGIPDWVLADAHITAGEEFNPAVGKPTMTIRFPYYRDGDLVSIKYRDGQKHFWRARDTERVLYGLDGIVGAEDIVIVEGEMDKLTIDAVHGPATVSVPDGAPPENATNYATKFDFLGDAAEERLRSAKRILIATDMDAPGHRLADELARRIGYAKCARVSWPEGCKDANDTLVTFGATAVCDALMEAQPYPIDGLVTPRELKDAVERMYATGLDRGVTSGWTTLDTHYRARAGLMTIVTGSPGSGKSHWLDNLMVRLAQRHDWTFGVCSPENQPLERHLAGLIRIWQQKPFDEGPTERMSLGEVREGVEWMDKHFAFILPDDPTLESIIERAEVLVYRLGIRGLVLDPWNELEHRRPDRMSETEYVSHALTRIRNWARRRGVQVWVVAHPTKLQKDKDGGYPAPTPYDISGSAHWFNKADACISVHREVDERGIPGDRPQVRIQKIRFAETGNLGAVEFRYDRATGRFLEA